MKHCSGEHLMNQKKKRKTNKNGMYIAIEGIDGTGKSTLMRLMKEFLIQSGFEVVTVQEPTNEDIGSLIRRRKKIQQDTNELSRNVPLDEVTEAHIDALLFAADRLQLHHQVIKPALQDGKIVLTDRSVYSSLAYQTCQGAKLEWVLKVNEYALKPELVLLLDCPAEVALERLKNVAYREKFENLKLLKCVREQYLSFSKDQENWFIIDATQNQNAVKEEVLALMKTIISINA